MVTLCGQKSVDCAKYTQILEEFNVPTTGDITNCTHSFLTASRPLSFRLANGFILPYSPRLKQLAPALHYVDGVGDLSFVGAKDFDAIEHHYFIYTQDHHILFVTRETLDMFRFSDGLFFINDTADKIIPIPYPALSLYCIFQYARLFLGAVDCKTDTSDTALQYLIKTEKLDVATAFKYTPEKPCEFYFRKYASLLMLLPDRPQLSGLSPCENTPELAQLVIGRPATHDVIRQIILTDEYLETVNYIYCDQVMSINRHAHIHRGSVIYNEILPACEFLMNYYVKAAAFKEFEDIYHERQFSLGALTYITSKITDMTAVIENASKHLAAKMHLMGEYKILTPFIEILENYTQFCEQLQASGFTNEFDYQPAYEPRSPLHHPDGMWDEKI